MVLHYCSIQQNPARAWYCLLRKESQRFRWLVKLNAHTFSTLPAFKIASAAPKICLADASGIGFPAPYQCWM